MRWGVDSKGRPIGYIHEPEDLEQICNACLNEYLQENNNEKSN